MARPLLEPPLRTRYVIVWSRLTEVVALGASAVGVLAAVMRIV